MAAPSTQRRTSLTYLPAIDGLRGILVISVVVYHFSITAGVAGFVLAPGSQLAVSSFFALSGFLITSLLLAERERTGTIDWKGFWGRRFRRLVPASLTVILACAVIKAVWPTVYGPYPWSDALTGILSVKNWQEIVLSHGTRAQQLRLLGPLSPYWSLAVEEQFYLGLSIVIALAARTRNSIGWLTGFLATVFLLSATALLTIDGNASRMYFGTDTRAFEVVGGCLLAVIVHVYGWPRWRGWDVVGWIGLIATLIAWAKIGEADGWVIHGGLLISTLLNTALIMGGITSGSFSRVMQVRPLVEIGKYSYPLYLVHWPIALVMQPGRMGVTGYPLMAERAVVSLAAAFALGQWVEKPIRTRRALPGWRGAAVWVSVAVAAVALCAWRGAT